MQDAHHRVEIIPFQIGVKLLCIHFIQLGKYTDLIFSALVHVVSGVISRNSFLEQICFSIVLQYGCSDSLPHKGAFMESVQTTENLAG